MTEQIIREGTDVRVTLVGTLHRTGVSGAVWIDAPGGSHLVQTEDPDVRVFPIDPDSPPLSRDVLAHVISRAVGGYPKEARTIQDAARAVLQYIEAKYPGLIQEDEA